MGSLVFGAIAIICGFIYIRSKMKGEKPVTNVLTIYFGVAVAGPAAVFGFIYLVGQFMPPHSPIAFLMLIPAFWIYLKVAEFFGVGKGKE